MRIGGISLTQPEYLYLLIPISIILLFALTRKYVKEDARLFRSSQRKRFIFATRMLFFTLLLIALSSPYIEKEEHQGNLTKIKVLLDNSYSMRLYDTEGILQALRATEIPLELKDLNMEEYTSLGNAMLNHLTPGENILLISDGQNNFGPGVEDISLFAASINSKIFGMELASKETDSAVYIEGPSKVVSDVENTFIVKVNRVGKESGSVKIYIDEALASESNIEREIEIKRSFGSGNHIIKAEIDDDDFFKENNVFYKTVSVHKKPDVLFVSEGSSPLFELYNEFYNVRISGRIEGDLDRYHAVVLDNINARDIGEQEIDALEEFLGNENGLLVVGGKDSYDWGDYNKSLVTNLLPVYIGTAKKSKDIVNLVILMDTGVSSMEEIARDTSYFDVQKSASADLLESISGRNNVAFMEANYYLNTLSGLSELGPKREDLVRMISLLTPHGASQLRIAYEEAHKTLKYVRGSRNIVIITDGILSPYDQSITLDLVKSARSDGIKTFIIGVGESADETFLKQVKEYGEGEYFRIDETHKLKLYFGEAEETEENLEIFVYDSNHFITEGLSDLTEIYGYNSVYPKGNARLLLSTSKGDPVLTVWNYGLGRVASLSTDDGSLWIPGMLEDINSVALIRTLNWLIENPERKNSVIIEIPDLRLGENSVISVKSESPPVSDIIQFYESEKDIYKANYYPENLGVVKILDNFAGVNYKKEYLNIGINPGFEKAIRVSGGEVLENNPELMLEQLKTFSKVETTIMIDMSWAFVWAAIVIYLFEITVRRIQEINQARKY